VAADDAVQVLEDDWQLVQANVAGLLLQLAVRVVLVPTVGDVLPAVTVQTGAGTTFAPQLSVRLTGAPCPAAFDARSV
jgi:hypothetical protein